MTTEQGPANGHRAETGISPSDSKSGGGTQAPGLTVIDTPRQYRWECGIDHCRFTATSTDEAETAGARDHHRAMHGFTAGSRVRLKDAPGDRISEMWPGRAGDTGTITHAYIDQNRYGVLLDRKGKCEGCGHCSGCGGPTTLGCQVKFENLGRTR